jgi:HK97 family phage portal protein
MERLSREPRSRGLNWKALIPWAKKADVSTTPLSLTDAKGWPRDTVAAGVSVNEGSVLALSAAWACVNLLAGTTASLPLMVYRTDRDGVRTLAKDHPLYRVLHDSPNTEQTAMDFWEGGTAALELRGNMHARIGRLGGRIVSLTPIYLPSVRRERGELRYSWTEDGRRYDLGADDVLHIRGFGGSPLGGLSPIAYGRQVFGLSTAVNETAGTTFANGVRPSLAITTDKFLTKDQRDPFEKALAEKHTGAMNSGIPLVLEGGLTPHNLSFSPEDAQMLESRGFSVEEICRFFGVPPFMIGHTEKSTSWGTGLEQQTLGFVKFTLRKRLKRIEQAIEKQLLTPADRVAGISVEFNLEGLLRGDTTARASFYQSGLQNGWTTINEVRALENKPPIEGGDVPRMQMQNQPITATGIVPAPAA